METIMQKDMLQNALDDEIASGEKTFGPDFKLRIVKILGLYSLIHPEGEHKESRRIPLSEWGDYHKYPSVGTLYQWNAKAKENGFEVLGVFGDMTFDAPVPDEKRIHFLARRI